MLGYRLAMLVPSDLVSYLAGRVMGWSNTYPLMAGLMALGITTTLWSPEPEVSARPLRDLQEAVMRSLRSFFSRRSAWVLLGLIVLYKLSDVLVGSLSTAFLICGVSFSAGKVGIINRTLSLAVTIVGALHGGTLMVWLGLVRALLLFGMLQTVSNLGYWVLTVAPQYLQAMAVATDIENICDGMGMTVFVVLLMVLRSRPFSTTQYALLLALASIGHMYVEPTLGYLVETYGWPAFYLITVVFVFPDLTLLWWMRDTIDRYKAEQNEHALGTKATKVTSV